MAKEKVDKDKLIENLKAENDKLRRKKKLEEALEKMDKRKKVLLLTILLGALILFVFLFAETAITASKPLSMTEADYRRMLSEIDGRSWTVTKKTSESLGTITHDLSDGKAKTERDGSNLNLSLSGEMECQYIFTLRNGEVRGMVGGNAAYLQYSESTLKTGRAITLLVGEEKVVFYEST